MAKCQDTYVYEVMSSQVAHVIQLWCWKGNSDLAHGILEKNICQLECDLGTQC